MGSGPGCVPGPAAPSWPVAGPRAGASSAPRPTRSDRIREALQRGTAYRSARVVVYVALSGGPSWAAFAVSRKVGGAVVRNRARRLLREAWRRVEAQVREGCQVVLVARPAIVGARAQDVAQEVRDMLVRAGIVQG